MAGKLFSDIGGVVYVASNGSNRAIVAAVTGLADLSLMCFNTVKLV